MAKASKVTFIPASDFTGYPHGKAQLFRADEASVPVAESFADLMRAKDLVKSGTHFTPADEPKDEK